MKSKIVPGLMVIILAVSILNLQGTLNLNQSQAELSAEITNLKRRMGVDGEYDTSDYLISAEQIAKAQNSAVPINFTVKAQAPLMNNVTRTVYGTVIQAGDASYIIALGISARNWYNQNYGIGDYWADAYVWNDQTGEPEILEPVVRSMTYNIAVFKAPERLKDKAVAFDNFGNSDELKVGTSVVIGTGIARKGTIASFFPPPDINQFLNITKMQGVSDKDFAIPSFPTHAFEWGSPVFASRDGKLELIGLLSFITPDGIGYIIKVNVFKKVIETRWQ